MEVQSGIEYSKPTITILAETPLLVAELAGRIAYDSFDKSEHVVIRNFNSTDRDLSDLDAEGSEILNSLAWVHHHHSVLEHINISFLIEGTSRGVLQELVRHRIAAYTVRSTRYTMSSVINAFVASTWSGRMGREWFCKKVLEMDMFVTASTAYNRLEIYAMFAKMEYQLETVGSDKFRELAVAKSTLKVIHEDGPPGAIITLYELLQAGKKKRNVGDAFKHIVTDNWKVDLVSTMNLRSLKNFLELRDSGAAYFQIRWLAQAMKEAMPSKYLDLIVKVK